MLVGLLEAISWLFKGYRKKEDLYISNHYKVVSYYLHKAKITQKTEAN